MVRTYMFNCDFRGTVHVFQYYGRDDRIARDKSDLAVKRMAAEHWSDCEWLPESVEWVFTSDNRCEVIVTAQSGAEERFTCEAVTSFSTGER